MDLVPTFTTIDSYQKMPIIVIGMGDRYGYPIRVEFESKDGWDMVELGNVVEFSVKYFAGHWQISIQYLTDIS